MSGGFEEYFNGSYNWGENITTDMITPLWRGQRPKQVIALRKPNPLVYKPSWPKQVWYAEGLLDGYYDLAAALNMTGVRGKRDRAFVTAGGVWLPSLSSFPYDYDQLLSYSLIVLGGAPAEALGSIGQEMLVDYVNAGGGMIVLGGPTAYARAGWRETALADLLPVTIAEGAFDLAELQEGKLQPTAEKAPFVQGLDWSAAPRTLYVHRVEVKPWAKVAVEAEGRPFLVYGEIGPKKARVACILAPAMGTLGNKETPFWVWTDWTNLLRQVAWWVMKEDQHFAGN